MEPRRFPPVPRMRPMRSSLWSPRRHALFLVHLAFLVACQDAPVAPNLRPRAASPDVSAAGTFVVINTADAGAGSLRQALADAEAAPGADLITFAIPGTDPGCSGGTCTITVVPPMLDLIQHEVTIDGTGSSIVVRNGGLNRVFSVVAPGALSLKFLTVRDGSSGFGGCLFSTGSLRLDHVTVQNCNADNAGGGIYSNGVLELQESVVADNTALWDLPGTSEGGGGIAHSGTLTMNKSSVERNTGLRAGGLLVAGDATITDSRIVDNTGVPLTFEFFVTGGIEVSGTTTMVRTLVSGNSSGVIGGIRNNFGNLTMINSTISGNGGSVAGLWNAGSMQLSHVTVAGNVGAVAAISKGSDAGKFRMSQSIVDGGAGPACEGVGTDDGYNIDRGATCGFAHVTSRSNTDPMVGTLADNGGQSFTHQLLTGSPALNAIPVGVNGCGTAGETDQRGTSFARLVGAGCDIGAFEYQVPLPVFSGFFAPVDNAPAVNVTKAGSAIPVKFGLGGNHGLNVMAAGYPTVNLISCSSSSELAAIEETVTAGKSSLSYDVTTDRYTYVWKSDKSWAGTCRRLTLRFTDGTTKSADFTFQ